MKIQFLVVLFGCVSLVCAQLPQGVEPRPNTTASDKPRCDNEPLGVDPDCGYDAPFCVGVYYDGGNGPTPYGCRPGLTGSFVRRTATADDRNLCNCPAGQYVRNLIDQSEPTGSCVPFTKIGQLCVADSQCVEARGRRIDSDITDDDNPDGQLWCIDGVCKECNVGGWSQAASEFDNVPVGQPYTCPGIDGPESERAGVVVLLSSRPGETRTCTPEGAIVGGGNLDLSLVTVAFSSSTTDPLSSSSTGTTNSSNASTNKLDCVLVALLAVGVHFCL